MYSAAVLCMGCADSNCWNILSAAATQSARVMSWTEAATSALDEQGRSALIDVPGSDHVLRISHSAGGCVQIDTLTDPAGTKWVTPAMTLDDYDLYCKSCPQRVSVGMGGGLYVLPSSDPVPPLAPVLGVRAALRDCTTLLPTSGSGTLRIETLANPRVAETRSGTIYAELVIGQGSMFYAGTEAMPEIVRQAITQVNEWLAPGKLTLEVVRARRLNSADPLALQRGDHTPLKDLHTLIHGCDKEGRAPDDAWVPLVLAGCLRITNPITKQTSEPEGFVPSVPSGLPASGLAHGVYIKGRGCDQSSPMIDWQPGSLARIIAHELGHYLGLYHSVESDGTSDRLDDTDADNVMHYRPSSIEQPHFSANQLRVLRQHPAIFWQ